MRHLLSFLPLFVVSVSALFDDALAGNLMLPLSAAAYSDAPQQCLDAVMEGATLSKQVTVKCDYFHDKCSGFTFVEGEPTALVRTVIGLSFRCDCTTHWIEH
ncbi:hypothetical protein PRIPAC_80546 [Pristionchus pacificus]|uniref:Uncharacterized protein n=1 Tax=Pristionchus pacificus TaxID=54126 RepID=A0A2A6CMX3_PRIPA|nr:hypothetical protein PRIPAC_80546 [Pristionchus pacificus]|eukprot:PDM79437.1 hypothetical protein PRIPAC_32016 [Pristionchus pacificus]